jgi:hypothetical protein
MAKKASEFATAKGETCLRSHLIVVLVLASLAGTQGCATQDRAARATEQAALAESEDDAACQKKGAPDSDAYDECRKALAEERARAAAAQEARRRDFDRTLGAGTDGLSNY